MNLNFLRDADLLNRTKVLSQDERDCLIKILHHLREIEKRRLFCDLGYKSLFDYTVSELKYSEGQASRRLNAMRLIKDLPDMEAKVASGELSLSNAQKAQSVFNQIDANKPQKDRLTPEKKRDVLNRLKGKSVREAEKELLAFAPSAIPKERERVVADDRTEIKFIIDNSTKGKLEQVRSLLGTKGFSLSMGELVDVMAEHSIKSLMQKKFGKCIDPAVTPKPNLSHEMKIVKNAEHQGQQEQPIAKKITILKDTDDSNSVSASALPNVGRQRQREEKSLANLRNSMGGNRPMEKNSNSRKSAQDTEDFIRNRINVVHALENAILEDATPNSSLERSCSRYLPKKLKLKIWQRDHGSCQNCSSKVNLNFDHIKPIAMGGKSNSVNLRLLCFNCNQRARDLAFGNEQRNVRRSATAL
jgi:hypothetical protein